MNINLFNSNMNEILPQYLNNKNCTVINKNDVKIQPTNTDLINTITRYIGGERNIENLSSSLILGAGNFGIVIKVVDNINKIMALKIEKFIPNNTDKIIVLNEIISLSI
jgi:hypothetical protein